ncbi:TPR-like protein [Cristinia sonorae]|uniref:TPR-like protein n=1 Tax=Cristinia sonorae TaxID=1940300 RepID=A0A8K0UNN3_9AGAR|nr:TPR-like protein [Cristinia sonorae]
MPATPPPADFYSLPTGMGGFSSPSSSRPRHSLNSSFSFGPQSLVNSYVEANSSVASNARSFALDPNRSILPASPMRSSPRLAARKAKTTGGGRHPLAMDNTDVFQDYGEAQEDGEAEAHEWGMVDRMRLWRHDALMQHLYETAAFWGDKVVSWTNDPNDAFWLAQTYFLTHQYSRAERLLTRPFPTSPPPPRKAPEVFPINGHAFTANMKGKGRETSFDPTNMPPPPLPSRIPASGPGEMVDVAVEYEGGGVSRLVDMSVACRYLAAQCQMRQGKWHDATEMLGEANPFRGSATSGPAIPNMDGGIKIEASMCHLRGILMIKLNRPNQAKNCFMEALSLDVKCYESFMHLVSSEMLTPDEEWDFVQSLAYRDQTPDDAEFVRLMYMSRLRKYKHPEQHAIARRRLVEDYGLGDNPDVLYSFADALYGQFRWADCLAITTRILGLTAVHAPTMPLHIACLHHISRLHSKLFILAHELVEHEPESHISWYAVGVWYMSVKKYSDARTYFSKTSLMDPRFSPAWIAFAHTFALEGEHDHAVTAYSTCSRMFNGSHLPLMFIGMEQIILSNPQQADEALDAAHAMCEGDPLLANERGVMAFNHGRYEEAMALFQEAINLAQVTQSSEISWASTYVNLGTCYRKLERLEDAKRTYKRVLQLDPRNSTALAFLGIVHHMLGEIDDAIVRYHETLSIEPINGHVIELLNIALESSASQKSFLKKAMPMGEKEWAKNMRERGTGVIGKRDKGKGVAAAGSITSTTGTVDEDMSI